MLARLRAKLTYANVVATMALFLALGGASYAAVKVTSRNIVNNSVRSADLRNNDIRSGDIRNRTILGRDILSDQVTGLQVRESTLGKVPDADSLDGQDSASFRVKCPGGTAFHAGACIETQTRATTQDFWAASRTCGTEGRRLPTHSELESFRQEPNITLASGHEVTSSVLSLYLNPSGVGGSSGKVVHIKDDGNAVERDLLDAEAFRCVAPLSN